MAYKVVRNFTDLRGDGHEYKEGDKYPYTGDADPERALHLMTPTQQRGALIEEVEEKAEKKAEPKEAKEPAAPKRKKKED